MAKKDFTLTSKFLMSLLTAGEVAEMLFPTPREFRRRTVYGNLFKNHSQFRSMAYYLIRKGWIKMEDKNNKRFVRLTKNGQIEALLAKTRLPQKPKVWDGKWRLIVFDIPEGSRDKRDFLRMLLKKNSFYKLQASVFISPYPLSREGVEYLKETRLIDYIRILKVEEIDDDRDLKKYFGLQ